MTLKRKSAYTYGFALPANAREFVESAVEYAQQGERRLWKFSALHMATAIELHLKAKLAMTDGYFRGPEIRWSNGKVESPRLHTDR